MSILRVQSSPDLTVEVEDPNGKLLARLTLTELSGSGKTWKITDCENLGTTPAKHVRGKPFKMAASGSGHDVIELEF